MSAMSDADLLRRVRTRDRDAAGALYDRFGARLYAVALRVTGSRDAAASVLEETFAALANGAAPDGAGEAWLLRLTRDLALASRQSQTPRTNVERLTPAPRSLVEEAFYGGASVAELAQRTGLTETEIRKIVADGIRELRK